MYNILVGFEKEEYPSIKIFEKLGCCTFLRYDKSFLEEHISEYDIIVPHLFFHLTKPIINKASRLKVMATPTTGSDHIDLSALDENEIHFISLNDDKDFIDKISSTAEMTWLLILACCRKFRFLIDRVQIDNSWINTDIRGHELSNKTLGIIGYGRLGKMVAKYGRAFGMRTISYDVNEQVFYNDSIVEPVDFEMLLNQADIISIHVKLNSTTKYLIDEKAINKMKRGVIIINTARGSVVDSEAVLRGLNDGRICSVGLDVCNREYQSTQLPDDPLVTASFQDKRIIITPHAGGSTYDAHQIVFEKVAILIDEYLTRINRNYE